MSDQEQALDRLGIHTNPDNRNWYYLLSLGTVVVAIFCLFYIFYLMFFPFKVIVLNSQPIAVTNRVLQAGEPLHYILDYCKSIETPASVSREFISADRDVIIAMPVSTSLLPMGCHKLTIAEDVPRYVPPGIYKMRQTRTYRLNAYRDIPYVFESESFEVLPAAK